MRYLVRKAVLGDLPEVEISEAEYSQLKSARQVLSSAFSIEEKYEILIANYLSLEQSLLEIATTNVVRRTLSYSEFFESRSMLNVRMVNLLTASRLYLDQLPQDITRFDPNDGGAADRLRAKRAEEYDQHFEYRFMEALRNYTQHSGIPIHYSSNSASWTSFEDSGRMEHYVDIQADRVFLAEDKKFKRQVMDEMPDRVDLVAASRRYVESLSSIHEFARTEFVEAATTARQTIEEIHTRYSKVFQGKLLGLTAIAFDGASKVDSIPLLLDWDNVRLELQRRNNQLVNLRKRYATGRSRDDRKGS